MSIILEALKKSREISASQVMPSPSGGPGPKAEAPQVVKEVKGASIRRPESFKLPRPTLRLGENRTFQSMSTGNRFAIVVVGAIFIVSVAFTLRPLKTLIDNVRYTSFTKAAAPRVKPRAALPVRKMAATIDSSSEKSALMWLPTQPLETARIITEQVSELLSGYSGHPAAEKYQLSGVVFDEGGGNVAIVNNQLIRVGDEVDGAHVVAIGSASVELEHLGQTIKLTV